jgi:hypothetical protein
VHTDVVVSAPCAHPARHEQDVERRTVVEPVIGDGAGALRARDRSGLLGDGDAAEPVPGMAERLERAEDVQQLEPGKEQHADRPLRHG